MFAKTNTRIAKVSFLLCTGLKAVAQHSIECFAGPSALLECLTLPIRAKRMWVGKNLHWAKEMVPDGNLNPQEQMKRIRNYK